MLYLIDVLGKEDDSPGLSIVLHDQVKREWEIGRCIHNIYEPEKALPGYMGTGEGVVTENGNFVGASATHPHYLQCKSMACVFVTREGLRRSAALI